MFKKLKITCDEATTICDKNQYGEATLLDKIKLNIHFIYCKICREYSSQNNILTTLYKGHAKSCQQIKHCLTQDDKLVLKKQLENFKD